MVFIKTCHWIKGLYFLVVVEKLLHGKTVTKETPFQRKIAENESKRKIFRSICVYSYGNEWLLNFGVSLKFTRIKRVYISSLWFFPIQNVMLANVTLFYKQLD